MGQCLRKEKEGQQQSKKGKGINNNNKQNIKPAVVGPNKGQEYENFVISNESGPKVEENKVKESSPRFSSKKLELLFNKYKDEESGDEQVIGPDGIVQLCTDLEISPEDVTTLLLAFALNAQEMGYFTKKEWMEGLERLQIDTIEKLKAHLPKLRAELDDHNKFKNIYRFAFTFSKETREQKCIDMEAAAGMLTLLMVDRYPICKSFLAYMQVQTSYKVLNLDQWMNLLEFCKVTGADFSNYDENGAWPCIIDEWVEWSKTEQSPRES